MKSTIWILLSAWFGSGVALAVDNSATLKSKSFGLGYETALNGKYGLFGAEIAVLPANNMDIHIGAGAGGGLMAGIGTRIFTTDKECFFLKYCSSAYFISADTSSSLGGEITFKSGENEGVYATNKVPFGSLAIGSRDIYFKTITLDFSVGYRRAFKKTEVALISGSEGKDDKEAIAYLLQSGLQVGFGLGLIF